MCIRDRSPISSLSRPRRGPKRADPPNRHLSVICVSTETEKTKPKPPTRKFGFGPFGFGPFGGPFEARCHDRRRTELADSKRVTGTRTLWRRSTVTGSTRRTVEKWRPSVELSWDRPRDRPLLRLEERHVRTHDKVRAVATSRFVRSARST